MWPMKWPDKLTVALAADNPTVSLDHVIASALRTRERSVGAQAFTR